MLCLRSEKAHSFFDWRPYRLQCLRGIESFGSELHLSIKNDLYGNIESHIEDFETYKKGHTESSSEGWSGLKKAKRTIMSDFGDNKNHLKFWIDQDQKTFNVSCIINLEKIKYESVNN